MSTESAKPYTPEQARWAADNLTKWCDEQHRRASQSDDRFNDEEYRAEAATYRAYADMLDALGEIRELAHHYAEKYTDDPEHPTAIIDSIAARFRR